MKLKIMVTGKNRRISVDICKHLENDRDCLILKCPASRKALFEMVPRELPNVVIICLGYETGDTVKIYDVLKETAKLGSITVIVVANDADRKLFMENTELERMFFLARPVSLFALYAKLNDIEERLEEEKEKNLGMLTEYENTNLTTFPRKHILVVDDDSEQLFQIKEHLKEFYEVTLVGSGKLMFRYLEKYTVDLILLDYLMPEMDGPEVLTRLRTFSEYEKIPVIFLTGVSERDIVIKTLTELKPQGYVLKPTRKSEIVAKIIDVLG